MALAVIKDAVTLKDAAKNECDGSGGPQASVHAREQLKDGRMTQGFRLEREARAVEVGVCNTDMHCLRHETIKVTSLPLLPWHQVMIALPEQAAVLRPVQSTS